MKYVDAEVTFAEIPTEINLCINISNCPVHCPDCHSKYLWMDIGEELTEEVIDRLLEENDEVTCVCIMGGDRDPNRVEELLRYVKTKGKKTAWYSGREDIPSDLSAFDYIKIGPYKAECGDLRNQNTNQRLYRYKDNTLTRIYVK